MKSTIFLLVFLIPILLLAQEKIEGKILNKNKEKILFASIGYYNTNIGTVSNAEGFFSIIKKVGDSIKISSVGYLPKTIRVREGMLVEEIILDDDIRKLEEVTIKTRTKTNNEIVLGHYKKSDRYLYLIVPEMQDATLITNPNKIRGYIDQVKFRLLEVSGSSYLLRVRLLNINKETGMPQEDLLFYENILSARQLKRVTTLNLKSKNIFLPEDGVYISFEWIPTEKTDRKEKPPYLSGNVDADSNYVVTSYKELKWKKSSSKSSISDGYSVPNVAIRVSY